ncbi:riboflavin kinase / FMN adenylyltransferase [Psychromonas ingrahamii 37]|uniref:Riboflavin biosynthesis protein n=1 Tax=Psychromonas ingrahamii (strain DSM 17664 / CCUG 51855 / 37) TaxID=357804 RepID=A1SZP4_PSYIN|nr:bifunctional riboflavin kinase/FAD synthetase [Psychromonas ingrahamii]ABM04959.1 riboflavin kinase / FMN adenylyltransferase [Psychromonas ingrahamii 37]
MELLRGIHNIKASHQGCVLSIGNFDGVHLGHKAVLSRLLFEAKRLKVPATVLTFEPQPAELFSGENAPARLSRLRDKFVQLDQLGLDRLLCVSFNRKFANLSAQEFIEELLIKKLGVKFLVIGDDFHFGYQRKGDFELLKKAGEKYGFEVVDTHSLTQQEYRISSSRIRAALAAGDMRQAALMLGRKYSITGRVVHGRKLGRTIGVPTANLLLKRRVSPVSGVFVVSVLGIGNQIYQGVANIGQRPTVQGVRQQLEVHIFNFNANLYGLQLEVVLEEKIRDEVRFDSFAELKIQIDKDIKQARQWHLLHK